MVRYPEVEVIHVCERRGVRQHDALGTAGRPAGIDESQNGVRVVNHLRTGAALQLERLLIEHALPRDLHSGRR